MSAPDAVFWRSRRALAAGNRAAIAAVGCSPLPAIRPNRLRLIEDAATMRVEIDKLLDFYRWSGMTDVVMSGFRCDGFDAGLDMVSLVWRPMTADGAQIAAIYTTYAVRRVADSARIAAVIAHNEECRRAPIIRDAMAEVGTLPSVLSSRNNQP